MKTEEVIPMFTFSKRGVATCEGRKIGRIRIVGKTTRTNPITREVCRAQLITVTLADGRVVPCTRLVGGNFMIVQAGAPEGQP